MAQRKGSQKGDGQKQSQKGCPVCRCEEFGPIEGVQTCTKCGWHAGMQFCKDHSWMGESDQDCPGCKRVAKREDVKRQAEESHTDSVLTVKGVRDDAVDKRRVTRETNKEKGTRSREDEFREAKEVREDEADTRKRQRDFDDRDDQRNRADFEYSRERDARLQICSVCSHEHSISDVECPRCTLKREYELEVSSTPDETTQTWKVHCTLYRQIGSSPREAIKCRVRLEDPKGPTIEQDILSSGGELLTPPPFKAQRRYCNVKVIDSPDGNRAVVAKQVRLDGKSPKFISPSSL